MLIREHTADINGYRARAIPPNYPGQLTTLMIGPAVFEISEDEIDDLIYILNKSKEAINEDRRSGSRVERGALEQA